MSFIVRRLPRAQNEEFPTFSAALKGLHDTLAAALTGDPNQRPGEVILFEKKGGSVLRLASCTLGGPRQALDGPAA